MSGISDQEALSRAGLFNRIRQVFFGLAISGLVLFMLARRLNLIWGWVYLGMWLLVIIGMTVIVEKK